MYITYYIAYASVNVNFTDGLSERGNAIAYVRLSVPLFPLYLLNRLTVDLKLLHVSGHHQSSHGTDVELFVCGLYFSQSKSEI